MLSAAYPSLEEANHARDVLRDFGILACVEREPVDAEGIEWCEVTAVELSERWVDPPPVVARGPRTSSPYYTELDEHDIGASSWWDDGGPGHHE